MAVNELAETFPAAAHPLLVRQTPMNTSEALPYGLAFQDLHFQGFLIYLQQGPYSTFQATLSAPE